MRIFGWDRNGHGNVEYKNENRAAFTTCNVYNEVCLFVVRKWMGGDYNDQGVDVFIRNFYSNFIKNSISISYWGDYTCEWDVYFLK